MRVDEQLSQHLREVGLVAAWLFGSRARGDAREDSDADVAVLCRVRGAPPSLMVQGGLTLQFGDALGVPRVDLVVLDIAPLDLRGRILQEGVLLWSDDEPARVRFTVETLSRYHDARPAIEAQDRAFLAAIAAEGL